MKKSLLTLLLPLAAFGQAGYNGPGRYEISSNVSRKVLDLDRNDQRTVIQFESRGTDNQTWDVQDAGGGFVYLRNGMNGYALTQLKNNNSEPVGGEPFNNSDMQRWKLESGNNGSLIIVNASGKALDIPYGSTNNGTKINTYNRNGEVNQQWSMRLVQSTNNGGWNNNNNNRPNRPNNNNNNNNRPNRYDNNDSNNNRPGYNNGNGNGAGQGNREKYFDDQAKMWKMNGDGACFYTEANYRGEAFCVVSGDQRSRMNQNWNNSFTSVRFFGRANRIDVSDQEDMRGRTESITRDVPNMRQFNRGNWNNRISSLRVN